MKIRELLESFIDETPLDDQQEVDYLARIDKQLSSKNPNRDAFKDELSAIDPDVGVVGTGSWADVYGKTGSDQIIKVALGDTGAMSYLRWATQHQDNPHVPKIHKMVNVGRNVYARMERLVPAERNIAELTPYEIEWLVYLATVHYVAVPASCYQVVKDYYVNNVPNGAYAIKPKRTLQPTASIIADSMAVPGVKPYFNRVWAGNGLVEVINACIDSGQALDIAMYDDGSMLNVMQRPGTGELVITDPLYGE